MKTIACGSTTGTGGRLDTDMDDGNGNANGTWGRGKKKGFNRYSTFSDITNFRIIFPFVDTSGTEKRFISYNPSCVPHFSVSHPLLQYNKAVDMNHLKHEHPSEIESDEEDNEPSRIPLARLSTRV